MTNAVHATGAIDSLKWFNEFMRDVIEVQKHRKDSAFTTATYIKNRLILDKAREKIFGLRISSHSGVEDNQLVWLNESYSYLNFQKNIGFKELIKANKSFGKYPSWEFKSAAQLSINFSEDLIKFESISDKSFVSPLAHNAFRFYNYRLAERTDEEVTVEVVPKSKFSPTFTGQMTFNINTCQLKHLDLTVTGDKGINFMDSLRVIQSYKKNDVIPKFTLLKYNGGVFKFYFSGSSYAAFENNEQVNGFERSFSKNEVVKDDSSSYRPALLVAHRAIPLTLQERLSYEHKDSVDRTIKRKPIIDSLNRLESRIRILPLLFSDKIWKSRNERRAIILDPIVPAFFFNTVEGFGIDYGLTFLEYFQNNRNISVNPRIRYGLSNGELNTDLSVSWYYKPKRRGTLNFSIGSTYRDLNPNGSLTTLQNTLNTLFFDQNFMKLYRKEYISVGIGRELVGNLYFSLGTEVARNYSVTNTRDYIFNQIKEKNFSSNNPISPELEDKLFPDHTSFYVNSSLIYTLRQPYITKDGVKIYKLPLGPRFIVSYRKGIPKAFHSASDYNYIDAEIQHEKLDMGLWGYGSYSVIAGTFFNEKNVFYPEWRHFSGNLALIFNPGLRSFHLLNFYTFSTNQYFLEGHIEHNFNQFFSNRVPVLRKLKAQELLGGAYLFQPEKGHYFESYVGIRRLMFRADFAVSFNKFGILDKGFKISYNF